LMLPPFMLVLSQAAMKPVPNNPRNNPNNPTIAAVPRLCIPRHYLTGGRSLPHAILSSMKPDE